MLINRSKIVIEKSSAVDRYDIYLIIKDHIIQIITDL